MFGYSKYTTHLLDMCIESQKVKKVKYFNIPSRTEQYSQWKMIESEWNGYLC